LLQRGVVVGAEVNLVRWTSISNERVASTSTHHSVRSCMSHTFTNAMVML
jgi:hypothetical protein